MVELILGLGWLFWVALVVYAVIMILLPFWVMRIRDDCHKTASRLAVLIQLQAKAMGQMLPTDTYRVYQECDCGQFNRREDRNCIKCGAVLHGWKTMTN